MSDKLKKLLASLRLPQRERVELPIELNLIIKE